MRTGYTPEARRRLLEHGFEPIILNGKVPISKYWQTGAISAERLAAWENENPRGGNTGLRTGRLAVFDIDLEDAAHAEAVADAIAGVLGVTDARRYGRKGVALCYFNAEEPLRKISVTGRLPGEAKPRLLVEVLGLGQQVAAYGPHPDTGKPYRWPSGDPLETRLEDLEAVSRRDIRRAASVARDALEEIGAEDLEVTGDLDDTPREVRPVEGDAPVTPDMLRDMLAHVDPACPRVEWIGWLGVIMESPLVDCDGEPVEDFDRDALAVAWSAGELSADHDPANYEGPDDVARAVASIGRYSGQRKGLGSLVEEARRNGYTGPARAYAGEELEAVRAPQVPAIARYYAGQGLRVIEGGAARKLEPVEEPEEDDRPLTAAELAAGDFPRVPHLWRDMILEGHVNSLDGDGGIGKTQALLQIGVAVAGGVPLFGREVRQHRVLLVLCEDGKGEVKARLEKVCGYLGVRLEDLPLEVWCRPGSDSTLAVIEDSGGWTPGPFYEPLRSRLAAYREPVFMGLDTISDIAVMDENKRLPQNTLAKRVLGGFSADFGTTTLLTRHPSKASMADGSYYSGSTAGNAAYRNRLLLKAHDKGTGRTLEVVKSNYGLKGSIDLHHSGDVLTF
ncbi:MAG: AAA family ATPase, partial [Proteobacteria bacterium]|nr:AAA family ATPase [Pseudomonadota bacterium]